jgi:hypothetical protein
MERENASSRHVITAANLRKHFTAMIALRDCLVLLARAFAARMPSLARKTKSAQSPKAQSPIVSVIRAGRNTIMNRRIFTLILSLGVAALFAPGLALAEDHLAEAISHTKEAIDHGKQGHADVLVTHAEAALTHAEAAEKAKANPHTAEGITHLKAAIETGKQGHADVATKHAEEALTHLEAATK